MEWDDLRFVLAVGRGGGFSAAAKTLGVNHATVSRRVSALEERIGARLFERLPHGCELTQAGEEAVGAAERMELASTELSRALEGLDQRIEGLVTITAPTLLTMGPLTKMLQALNMAHPGLNLRLLADNAELNLHRRAADIAIRWTDAPAESLYGMRMTSQRGAVFAAPDYLERLAPDAPLGWIGLANDEAPPQSILAHRPNTRLVFRSNDKIVAGEACAAGIGAARLPCFYGDTRSGLMRAPGFALRRYRDYWLLTHRDMWNVARVRLVMRFLAAQAKALQPLFMGERPRLGA